MRVKIIKSSDNRYWYSDYIGKEFNVEESSNDYIISDNKQVKDYDDTYSFYTIAKEDCEIVVEEENKLKGEKLMSNNELNRDLSFLEDYINIALGMQTLEHYDSNYLSGDNTKRSREMLDILKLASEKLEEIKKEI